MSAMTWIGCPRCRHDPNVVAELATCTIMRCDVCGWFGQFSDCWIEDVSPQPADERSEGAA